MTKYIPNPANKLPTRIVCFFTGQILKELECIFVKYLTQSVC